MQNIKTNSLHIPHLTREIILLPVPLLVTIQHNRNKRKKARIVTVQSALDSFILAFEAY
jgi:hypothetical protein